MKIDPNESPCLEWEGKIRAPQGYGVRKISGKERYAHRVAYCEAHGLSLEDIADKMVLHHCDNRRCVNPDHLYLGTAKDNARDRTERSPRVKGEELPTSKLKEEEVRQIYVSNENQEGLAMRFGISVSQVCGIQRGKFWKHITEKIGPPRRDRKQHVYRSK